MNVYEADPTPENLAIAQMQADQLNGNALRSLGQFKGALVHTDLVLRARQGRAPAARGSVRQEGEADDVPLQVRRTPGSTHALSRSPGQITTEGGAPGAALTPPTPRGPNTDSG